MSVAVSVTRRCMAGSVIAFAMSADHRNRRNRRNRRGPAYGHELIPFEDHLHDTDTSTQVTGLQVCTSIPALYILHCAARTGSSGPGMPADIAPGPRYVRSIATSVLANVPGLRDYARIRTLIASLANTQSKPSSQVRPSPSPQFVSQVQRGAS